jgi:Nucleotide modification associated domain 2
MPKLYSYTVRVDDGAAPNPFRGLCTLTICKPVIRRVAEPGDWIAVTGSRNAPSGDLSGYLVYAMRVDEVLSLANYDQCCGQFWRRRIPGISSLDLSERLGNCIYDFSRGEPIQRPCVHGPLNISKDLSGQNALVSKHFYYFGSRAIPLPPHLAEMCHQTQGHRSDANDPFFKDFVRWIEREECNVGQPYGWPDYIVDWESIAFRGGCPPREQDDQA